MKLKLLTILAFAAFTSTCSYAGWDENWTGEIGKVLVYENESAAIFISNPRNGPSGSMDCQAPHNIVYLGIKDIPAPKALLSQAIVVYVSKKTIRFGIRVSGGICEAAYITAE